nr:MAG TPA: hypothetical protein [Myoviridae sp. ctTS62]
MEIFFLFRNSKVSVTETLASQKKKFHKRRAH